METEKYFQQLALNRSESDFLVAFWKIASYIGEPEKKAKSLITKAIPNLAKVHHVAPLPSFRRFVWNYDQVMCDRACPRTADRAHKYFYRKNNNFVIDRGAFDWVRDVKGAIQGGQVELFRQIINNRTSTCWWDTR